MTFAEIFRLGLVALMLFSVAVSLINIGEGNHTHEQKPLSHVIAAILGTLLALGILFLLEAKP